MNKIKDQTPGKRCKVKDPQWERGILPLDRTTSPSIRLPNCASQVAGYAPCSFPPASVQRGFSLVTAIFLLVVIAALGTFAVTLSTSQQQSAALDVLGSRAYQASRAGIEWGAYQVLRNSSCPAPTTLAPLPNTLSVFNVTVTCTATSPAYDEAGTTVNMFQLTSTATQGAVATPDYVERQMSVTIAK